MSDTHCSTFYCCLSFVKNVAIRNGNQFAAARSRRRRHRHWQPRVPAINKRGNDFEGPWVYFHKQVSSYIYYSACLYARGKTGISFWEWTVGHGDISRINQLVYMTAEKSLTSEQRAYFDFHGYDCFGMWISQHT